MKSESLLSQKSSSEPCSTADAEIFNVHRLLLAQKPFTKTRTLGPKNHPRGLVLQLRLTSSTHIDYCGLRTCWWKLSPSCPKNHPRHQVLRLTLKSSTYIDYCWLRNRLQKRGPWDQNHPTSPVLRLTLTSSAKINYSWQTNRWSKLSPCCPETQFYRWRWKLHCT